MRMHYYNGAKEVFHYHYYYYYYTRNSDITDSQQSTHMQILKHLLLN